VIEQAETDDRTNDENGGQSQSAHGALLEVLLVASDGCFCHGFPDRSPGGPAQQ